MFSLNGDYIFHGDGLDLLSTQTKGRQPNDNYQQSSQQGILVSFPLKLILFAYYAG